MIRMKYTPKAVEDCLELNDHGDKEDGGSNKALNTLWIKDLEFQHGSSSYVLSPFMISVLMFRYRLSVLESGPAPLLRLVHTPLQLYPITSTDETQNKKPTVVFDRLPSTNLHWVPEGIVYVPPESDSVANSKEISEAKLCRVSGYRWIRSAAVNGGGVGERDEGMQVD